MNEPDQLNQTLDLANLRLRLRSGLNFELQEFNGEPCYVVKNEVTSSYFQIGLTEYAFISLLDGDTSLQEAVRQTSYLLGENAFTLHDGAGTYQWLLQNGFADPVNESDNVAHTNVEFLLSEIQSQKRNQIASQLNPLFLKFPLFNPQRLLRAVAPMLGWIFSRTFLLVWVCVILAAAISLVLNRQSLLVASHELLVPNRWLWIVLTFVFMKLIHELAHGLACVRFGGRVKEAGVLFILCVPIPYVDVTSSWGFPSKWQRIGVSVAGMYVELFIAAVALIGFGMTNDPVIRFHLLNLILTGSLTTILFNANFLMRFDGYYILADILEIPNLAQLGQQYLQYLGKRYLIGMNVQPPRYPRTRGILIGTYGILAFCWRIMIYVSLSIIATAMFFGFGIALAVFGGAIWLGVPLFRFVKMISGKSNHGSINLKPFFCVTMPVCIGILLALVWLPWPYQLAAPAFIQFENPSIVRAETAGFVAEILVSHGEYVERGELLIKMQNRDLLARIQSLEAEREQSLVRSRRHHAERAIAAHQAEVGNRLALEQQLNELVRQVDNLTLRAPASGIVIGHEIESSLGTYVAKGTDLFQVVDESRKEVVLSVGQDRFDEFLSRAGEPISFVQSRFPLSISGRLNQIDPMANSRVDARLTSFGGGPLAVRSDATKDSAPGQNRLETVLPRFRGTASIQPAVSTRLASGVTGFVYLNCYPESVAEHAINVTRRWLRSIKSSAHQQSEHSGVL